MRVLVIDNYDSFVYNLVQYVGALGAKVTVLRNDAPVAEAKRADPDAVLISPGPGHPRDARLSLAVLREMEEVPTLGVCLGHQAIGLVFGAKVTHAAVPMHGKTSRILHNGQGVFRGLPSPLTATRYHSLVVKDVKSPLGVTARTEPGEVMALRHSKHPIEGVQFHPESVLTVEGKRLLRNFVELAAARERA